MIKTTKINIEQFFGIIPIDEQSVEPNPTIAEILKDNKSSIDAVETRKSADYYENLKEKETPK